MSSGSRNSETNSRPLRSGGDVQRTVRQRSNLDNDAAYGTARYRALPERSARLCSMYTVRHRGLSLNLQRTAPVSSPAKQGRFAASPFCHLRPFTRGGSFIRTVAS